MTIFEMGKKYYPQLWNEKRIRTLAEAGKLTQAEAEQILHNTSIVKDE